MNSLTKYIAFLKKMLKNLVKWKRTSLYWRTDWEHFQKISNTVVVLPLLFLNIYS